MKSCPYSFWTFPRCPTKNADCWVGLRSEVRHQRLFLPAATRKCAGTISRQPNPTLPTRPAELVIRIAKEPCWNYRAGWLDFRARRVSPMWPSVRAAAAEIPTTMPRMPTNCSARYCASTCGPTLSCRSAAQLCLSVGQPICWHGRCRRGVPVRAAQPMAAQLRP